MLKYFAKTLFCSVFLWLCRDKSYLWMRSSCLKRVVDLESHSTGAMSHDPLTRSRRIIWLRNSHQNLSRCFPLFFFSIFFDPLNDTVSFLAFFVDRRLEFHQTNQPASWGLKIAETIAERICKSKWSWTRIQHCSLNTYVYSNGVHCT